MNENLKSPEKEQTEMISTKSHPETEKAETHKKNKWLLLLIGMETILIIALVIVAISFMRTSLETVSPQQTIDVSEEVVNTEAPNESDSEERGMDKKQIMETESEAQAESSLPLYVAVPSGSTYLLSVPMVDAEEDNSVVIAEITPGTRLRYLENSLVVENDQFLEVMIEATGQSGYILASDAMEVDYDADMEPLQVVETDSVLYTYDMMVEDINTLCRTYSDRLKSDVIGYSNDGRALYRVTLGNPNAKHHIMLQAAIHGREYMNTQMVMKMIEYYAFYYDDGTYHGITYRELFDDTAFHIVPMANPDGVTISQFGVDALEDEYYSMLVYDAYMRDYSTMTYEENVNGDMNWFDHYREDNFDRFSTPQGERFITFEEYQTLWKANAEGVDLNNNFDAEWDDIDLKHEPSYTSFKGWAPQSEPETIALVEMATELEYECYISYHSTGSLIYYDCKGNTEEMVNAEEKFANSMHDYVGYRLSNTNTSWGVNLGGFSDWIQLKLESPSVTIESGKKPCPLPIEEFEPMWNRHRESWAKICMNFLE